MADPIGVHIKNLGSRPVNGTERVPTQRSTESIAYQNTIDELHSYRWHFNARPPTTADNAADGYGLTHHWVDTSANPVVVYVKVAESGGVATWVTSGGGGGGGGSGTATAIIETDGPDTLGIGAILDGQLLKRIGNAVVGVSGVGTTIETVGSARTLSPTDNNKVLLLDGTFTVTLPADPGEHMNVKLVNIGAGLVTVEPDTGATLAPDPLVLTSATAEQFHMAELFNANSEDWYAAVEGKLEECVMVAASDEVTNIEALPARIKLRWPYSFLLTRIRASVNEAPQGAPIVLDVNVDDATVLSTKVTIEAGETTSVTATDQPVISAPSIADNAEVEVDFDSVGSTNTGRGVKVYFYGYRA